MSFDYSKIKNPDYFEENRVPAHSDHLFYKNLAEAQSGVSGFAHCLNGLWKFSYAKNYASAIPGFEAADYCCKRWDDIRVPAHIQLEGYGEPQYANIQNPWDGYEDILPGEIPSDFNPVASYVKYFTLPENLRGFDNLYVSFGGVETSFALWLNGHYVGYASDSMTPSDFDLTPYYNKDGENKLAAQVFKWSSGSWLQDQDFFRFSGIFRDVFLYVKPQVHIEDIKIIATLDDSYTTGLLSVTLKSLSAGKATIQLIRLGETIGTMSGDIGKATLFEAKIEQPDLWSAETPNLYDLIIEISDDKGNLQEVIAERVGFRRFEMKDRIMHLNGKRIVFNGVNRHEFGCLAGRVVTVEETRIDLATMKRHNINAVRTSHYPNNSYFYHLCDEYGLYVIDEANLESHSSWDYSQSPTGDPSMLVPGDKPEWLGTLLARANNMYQRDKNRPCVLIWSCGNESFGGKNIYEMSKLLHKDSTRIVHYEGIDHDPSYPDTTDLYSKMYTPADEVEEYLKENREKPLIMCEYIHAMGNSCGAMHKYIELGEREPLYQGGFIWDYIDQCIVKKDRYGNDFFGYGGDFDDRPADYEFCGNGIVYGDRTPSPKMQEVKFIYQNIKITVKKDTVLIQNKNLFTSTAAWNCVAVLEKEGRLLTSAPLQADVPPLESREYPLPFAIPEDAGEYAVTVAFFLREATLWADKGYEIAFGQGVIKVAAKAEAAKPAASPPLKLINGWHNCGVKGEHFDVLFSKLTGGLVSYRWAGVEMLKRMPVPNFWRAPNDNDRGNFMPARYGQWHLASKYLSSANPNAASVFDRPAIALKKNGENAEISFIYHLPTKPAAQCEVLYSVACDGTISVTMSCDAPPELGDMPVFGMMFKLSADYELIQWYGNGPDETYADRKQGAKLGVYQGLVAEQMANYLVPQETGNKTDVRWASVTDSRGRGLDFYAQKDGVFEFSALPYTPFEIENAAHPNELPPIHYTIVRVNMAQMGVAGDNTWGAKTHPEYLLPTGKISFTFSFKGI